MKASGLGGEVGGTRRHNSAPRHLSLRSHTKYSQTLVLTRSYLRTQRCNTIEARKSSFEACLRSLHCPFRYDLFIPLTECALPQSPPKFTVPAHCGPRVLSCTPGSPLPDRSCLN